jgi:hypothetical protein
LFIAQGLPRLFGTAEDFRVNALADRLGVLGPGNVGIHGTNTAQLPEYPMVVTGEHA